MNSAAFLNEVKSSSICPDNFEKVYAEFQLFQKAAMDTLKEVHRVCEKNSVPYHLQYGSLLGFIRDGGQIPWDYDVDIFVPYEQRANLIAALKKDLASGFYFYCPETDKKCRHMIIRVAPVEYNTIALHVDVFFYVGTPEDAEERTRFAKRIKELSVTRYNKLVKIRDESSGDIVKALKAIGRLKIPTLFTRVQPLEKEYHALCSSYSSTESTYCISADIFAMGKQIPSSLLHETKLAECEYGTFRIPVHYEKLLEIFYGDYKAVPSLESRINEVLKYHKIITTIQKREKL